MSRLIIQGGHPISGTFTPFGNKNAVLPMLAACVLTDQPVRLTNVPMIQDVRVMLDLLAALGVDVQTGEHEVTLCAKGLRTTELDPDLCKRVRGSILFAGPLTARHGRAVLYPPGGDVIGRRRLDTHFDGLEALGIDVESDAFFRLQRRALRGAELILDEASVTATENILMAAVLAEGTTTIYNTACEPHVQDLGGLLQAMGAKIKGLGTNYITIEGVDSLQGADYAVQPDHIEIGSFAVAAAITGGSVQIPCGNAVPAIKVINRTFAKLGLPTTLNDDVLTVSATSLEIQADLGLAIPKVEDGPWPAFPSDMMSVAIVLATQSEGTVLFFEKMFESRMYFVDQLIAMGARIVQCDPHRIVIAGSSALQRAHMATPDIRAGMALLNAALCAQGESVIDNAQMIDRGYERIDERLRALGAHITRENRHE